MVVPPSGRSSSALSPAPNSLVEPGSFDAAIASFPYSALPSEIKYEIAGHVAQEGYQPFSNFASMNRENHNLFGKFYPHFRFPGLVEKENTFFAFLDEANHEQLLSPLHNQLKTHLQALHSARRMAHEGMPADAKAAGLRHFFKNPEFEHTYAHFIENIKPEGFQVLTKPRSWKRHETPTLMESSARNEEGTPEKAASGLHLLLSLSNSVLQEDSPVLAMGGVLYGRIVLAFEGGHKRLIDLLLQENSPLLAMDDFSYRRIERAFKGGHERLIDLLLQDDSQLLAMDEDLYSRIEDAFMRGDERLINQLLEQAGIRQTEDLQGDTLM
jgi:hypothetical protein